MRETRSCSYLESRLRPQLSPPCQRGLTAGGRVKSTPWDPFIWAFQKEPHFLPGSVYVQLLKCQSHCLFKMICFRSWQWDLWKQFKCSSEPHPPLELRGDSVHACSFSDRTEPSLLSRTRVQYTLGSSSASMCPSPEQSARPVNRPIADEQQKDNTQRRPSSMGTPVSHQTANTHRMLCPLPALQTPLP